MRILCLHGMGTNAAVFSTQTAALRAYLGGPAVHSFEFIEGEVDCPAAPGIASIYAQEAPFYAYFDHTNAQSILKAIDDLSEYVDADGPFDGVMGFSQGAALAAMLLARRADSPMFSFAIFICAGAPFCENSLREGEVKYLDPANPEHRSMICVPSAHVIGARDESLDASVRLESLCTIKPKFVFDHGAGHEIPVTPREITAQMGQCIEDVIAKATLVQ